MKIERYTIRVDMDDESITGEIKVSSKYFDGIVCYSCSREYAWEQWAAPEEVLRFTMPLVEHIHEVIFPSLMEKADKNGK